MSKPRLAKRRLGVPEFAPLLPGEVRGYPRKSTATETASKSLEDQTEVIVETAAEYGIPLAPADVRAEKPGHGGDEWWVGGGGSGLLGDAPGQRARYRPVLTQIMNDVVAGKVRCVLVWSQDRLWRDVGICNAVMDLFVRYGVQLYDRNGLVDIYTPDGQTAVRAAANAAQNYRLQCAESSPRGIRRSAKKGVLVTDPNRLGFRGGGRYSKKVVHVADEQDLVRRIYCLFDAGEGTAGEGDGSGSAGPLGFNQIAQTLMDEGYAWTRDLHETRGKQRNEHTRDLIYVWQVKRVLTDLRYIGKQPWEGDEWDCPAYLNEGKPVVDPALWHRVQDKIQGQKRVGNAGKNTERGLTGLLRCGLCGQAFQAADTHVTYKDGSKEKICYWRIVKANSATWAWCTHSLPCLRETVLDAYVDTLLAPALLAEMRDKAAAGSEDGVAAEKARLERELGRAECHYRDELPGFRKHVSPQMFGMMEQECLGEIRELKDRLQGLEQRVRQALGPDLEGALENVRSLSAAARRDALRACLRWVAILPDEVVPNHTGRALKQERVAGRVVFLSAWGTYHTATIVRGGEAAEGDRLIRPAKFVSMRPAHPTEIVGSVADFPDPEDFVMGLQRAYRSQKYPWCPHETIPGYVPPGGGPPPIAEFEV